MLTSIHCRVVILQVDFHSVVSWFPRCHFHDPHEDLIAESLLRQDGKRFLKLIRQFFDSVEEGREEERCRDQYKMVPASCKLVIKSHWQECGPEQQESSCVSRVEKGNWTAQEALTATKIVFKLCQGHMQLPFSQKVHRKVLNGHTQVKQSSIWSVVGFQNGFRLCIGQFIKEFFLKIVLIVVGRQVAFHTPHKSPCTQSKFRQIFSALVRLCRFGVIVPSNRHAKHISGSIDIHSPVLAGFVPSRIASVGAKDKQETQGSTRKGKRCHGKFHLW
mmetsp:Transcript_85388/g.246812  ORF Transcript_85388/g.246812 Transcript_85388/m.246812 type:complete len:275 (-) Transcript_85388:16-840(-)